MANSSSASGIISARLFSGLVAFLILALWMYDKFTLFNLCAYTSDLFSHLQISEGWLRGKPLLFENCYGDHSRIHNYYLTPLLGIFTYPFGAYGLFIAHSLFLLAGALLLVRYAKSLEKPQKELSFLLLLVFYLGPTAFWIWDNPKYGFHIEVLYVPLSLFFILALQYQKTWLSILCAALIVIAKEDGAVLAACLHLSWLVSRRNMAKRKEMFRIGAYLLGWLVLFVAGLLLLSYKSGAEDSRLLYVFHKLNEVQGDAWPQYFGPMFRQFALLLIPATVFMAFFLRLKYLLWAIFFILPLAAVELISGLLYYPAVSFGLTWVPRFSIVWAFLIAFIAGLLFKKEAWTNYLPRQYSAIFLLVSGLVLYALQMWVLKQSVDYPYTATLLKPHTFETNTEKLANIATAKCIASQLPRFTNVAPPAAYFSAFPYQTIIWYDHLGPADGFPDVVLEDATNRQISGEYFMKDYDSDSIGEFKIFIRKGFKADLSRCR